MPLLSYLYVGSIIGLSIYQTTVSDMVQRNRRDRIWLQRQIESNERSDRNLITWANRQDPKSKESIKIIENLPNVTCVYWHGNDITINEAKEQLEIMNKKHSNLLYFSPYDRVMKIFSE